MNFYPVAQLSNVVRAVLSFVKSHYIYIYLFFQSGGKKANEAGNSIHSFGGATDSVGHILLIFFSFFFHPDKTASTQELYLSTNGFLFNQDLITPTQYQSSQNLYSTINL